FLPDKSRQFGRSAKRKGRVEEDFPLDADTADKVLTETVEGQIARHRGSGLQGRIRQVADHPRPVAEIADLTGGWIDRHGDAPLATLVENAHHDAASETGRRDIDLEADLGIRLVHRRRL